MVRTRVAAAFLGAAVLSLSGCSSGAPQEKKDPANANPGPCKELLGTEGMAWFTNHTTESQRKMNSSSSVTEARTVFRDQVLAWKPADENDIPRFVNSELCHAGNPQARDKDLVIEYGASTFPFDFAFEESNDKREKRVMTEAGPDVKLLYWKDPLLDDPLYYVYIRCGVPGAPISQLNEVPLEGKMKDSLTRDKSQKGHFQHLLHSAKVMAEEFGCTNKPEIPTTVPASVKD
ncbi:hypothetical protein H9Y04_42195 [Streptomyces sp. TRM66268-LWL]|uniref:Lipoprotein n=1 Tax=Streptomyces polyasparticus TaxID=2767826 RepID=A0ABR7SXR7_9ACTN|nr:hypothetical protein [Streptomyces polyasparticus]MBC9719143.1 hypothetical protein [Streptomyces polyasparticus]